MKTLILTLLSLFLFAFAYSFNAEAFVQPSREEVLARCDLSQVAWADAEPLEIVLKEFNISPEKIDLVRCRPYLFRLTNVGRHFHNFVAPAFFARAVAQLSPTAEPDVPTFSGLDTPRDTMTELRLIATEVGIFPYKCTVGVHDMLGMRGELRVMSGE